MQSKRQWRERFFEEYYHTKLGFRGHVTKQMKQRVRALTHLIVDTGCLAGPTLHYVGTRLATHDTVATAYRATYGALPDTTMGAIHSILPAQSISHQPVMSSSEPIQHTIWHLGEHYTLYAISDISMLLQLDVTDNERERIVSEARRAAGEGKLVYITATATSVTRQPSLRHLTFTGLIVVQRQPIAGLHEAMNICKTHGIALHYLSCDPELTMIATAHESGLPKTVSFIPRTASPTNEVIHITSEREREQLTKLYSPETSLVCHDQLPDFTRMLRAVLQ